MGVECLFPLYTTMLEVTYKCPWRCSHCYLGDQKPIELKIETIEKVFKESHELGTKTVVITGGEPTLHRDWVQIINKAKDYGFSIQLETTNVKLKDDKKALDILKDIDEIHLSIDVPPNRRGLLRPQHYNRDIVKFIRVLKSEDCNMFLFCTLYRDNMKYIDELIELANELEVPIRFNFLLKEGRANNLQEDVFLSKEEIKELFLKLYMEYKKGRIPRTRIIYQCLVDSEYQQISKQYRDVPIIGGCIAGIASCTITAYGDVLPCPHLRIPVGNVYKQNLKDIWINSDLLIKLRDRNNLKGSCKFCEYRNICGGCRAAAYWITGDVFGEDPICFKDLL